MLSNIIYFIVFLILAFVLSIAVKAITRGVEAKQIIKDEKNLDQYKDNQNPNLEFVDQIKELNDLYDKGILNDDEFKKAKEKGKGNNNLFLFIDFKIFNNNSLNVKTCGPTHSIVSWDIFDCTILNIILVKSDKCIGVNFVFPP